MKLAYTMMFMIYGLNWIKVVEEGIRMTRNEYSRDVLDDSRKVFNRPLENW